MISSNVGYAPTPFTSHVKQWEVIPIHTLSSKIEFGAWKTNYTRMKWYYGTIPSSKFNHVNQTTFVPLYNYQHRNLLIICQSILPKYGDILDLIAGIGGSCDAMLGRTAWSRVLQTQTQTQTQAGVYSTWNYTPRSGLHCNTIRTYWTNMNLT